MNNQQSFITTQVERALSHHIAHDLNNVFGAIEFLGELLAEDIVGNDKALNRLDKIRLAASIGQLHVQSLRRGVPKHNTQDTATVLHDAFEIISDMITEHKPRLRVDVPNDLQLVGGQAVVTYVLYHIVGHVIGGTMGDVYVKVAPDAGKKTVSIILRGDLDVGPMNWEQPFFDDVLAAHSATLVSLSGDQGHGFILHWPAVSV